MQSPTSINNHNQTPTSGNNTNNVPIARLTHTQHGIYSSLLSTATSSSANNPVQHQPSEAQILEKSISLTAAAPPLKLAPPFPGACPALNTSNFSALQQIQRSQNNNIAANKYSRHHFAAAGDDTSNSNNNNNFLTIGGISGRGEESNWKNADPSKTHAVVVALCLGRAAWDFPSDDAPVELVNKGAPPLLSVDVGDNNNNSGDGNNKNNNNDNMNIFSGQLMNNNNQDGGNNAQIGGGHGVAFYVEQGGGNNNNNNQLMLNKLMMNTTNGGNNNNNQQQNALLALQALAAKDVSNTTSTTTAHQKTQQQKQNSANNGAKSNNNDSTKNKDGNNDANHPTHHQTALQAAVAAANNNNQGTIHPPGAPSTLYSWRALRAHSDVANRSAARAGEGLEALYLEMMKQKFETRNVKVITPLVNPTTENIRDVLHKGATDAQDEMQQRNNNNRNRAVPNPNHYAGPNKILLHYVGHGVLRPERGCMYFARQATQRQHHAFAPVRDILQLMGAPCMLLCDCASAGNIRSAVVAFERDLNPYASTTKDHRFFWGSCSDGEPLPHHPLMPDDLFSSIMISPIRMAVLFFIIQKKNLYDFPPYLIHCFANEWITKPPPGHPVAEVRNAFNAVVESIAAKVLSPDVFNLCFRQDSVVINLFRAFVLAQRIIGSLGCEPCSHPDVPPDTALHPLWQSFDLVVEGVLGSIMRQWRPKPSHGLSVHAFRMSLDPTLVMKNMPETPTVPVSTFFLDSLVALQGQFDSAQAQALAAASVVEPPSTSQAHHNDLLSNPQHQQEVLSHMQQQHFLLNQQNNPQRDGNNNGGNTSRYGGGGGDDYFDRRGPGGRNSYPYGGTTYNSESDQTSSYDSSGANTVDFASYLLTRGENNHTAMMQMQNVALSDQQVQQLLGSIDDFPSRELISFVGTRFPILQHSIVGRETRFFGYTILARWLDLGAPAVDCCELFGLYRELLAPLWSMKPVDDQDPVLVMIAAKTALVDARILQVAKSLQIPVNYCAKVLTNPQEPRDPTKLGILGQANTQRWFSAGTIALCLLRQPQLSMTCLITVDAALREKHLSSVTNNNYSNTHHDEYDDRHDQDADGNNDNSSNDFNPYLSIGQTHTCNVSKSCVEILETPIPSKLRNALESDSEPSIASNLKSSCLAVLGSIAFSLRDCFVNAVPVLPPLSSPSSNLHHQSSNNAQQLNLLLQLLQQQFIYQPGSNHDQIRFVTQFLLPSLKDSWIDAVGTVLAHKDSTPRIRWGCARTLHVFLTVLTKICYEAEANRRNVFDLLFKTQQQSVPEQNNNSQQRTPPSHPSTPNTFQPINNSFGPSSYNQQHQDQEQQQQEKKRLEERQLLQTLDPQLSHHLNSIDSITDYIQGLQVSIVGKLVTHCSKTEANVDVRREILGALTAFCLSQSELMLSDIIQGELRSLFTGTPSPNRFGTFQNIHPLSTTGSPNHHPQQQGHNNNNNNILLSANNNFLQQPSSSSGRETTISPNSQQLLQHLQPNNNNQNSNNLNSNNNKQYQRSNSDFDPSNPSHIAQHVATAASSSGGTNNNQNQNQTNNQFHLQHLVGGGQQQQQQNPPLPGSANHSQFLVSGQTTPQVSAIHTPHRLGTNYESALSRGASRLDASSNNLTSPATGGGNVVRSVPFQQQQQQQQQQSTNNNNNNVNNQSFLTSPPAKGGVNTRNTTPPSNIQQNLFGAAAHQTGNNSSTQNLLDLSAETTSDAKNHNNTTDEFVPTLDDFTNTNQSLYLQNNMNNHNNNNNTIIDKRVIILLLVVRWILSLRHDAHPVLRVLCIRALQKFVADQLVTIGLFSKPQNNANKMSTHHLHTHQDHHHQNSSYNNNQQQGFGSTKMSDLGGTTMSLNESGLGGGGMTMDHHHNNNNNNNQQSNNNNKASQQPRKTMFGKLTDFFSTNKNNSTEYTQRDSTLQPKTKSILSARSHVDPYSSTSRRNNNNNNDDDNDMMMGNNNSNPAAGGPSDLDKFLFSETDASILFDFEAPSLSLLDLETSDVAMVEFINEMLRGLNKPVIPRICQRISLGDLPARFTRPETTAAAISQACSAPLVGDVAPHRCVFHSYVRRTLAQAKSARHDTSVSDIVQRHVYSQIDASHIVFHPSEHFAVCCSQDEVLSVVSTAPKDKRVFLSERMDRILPNGVEEADIFHGGGPSSRLGAGEQSSEGDSYRTPTRLGGVSSGGGGGYGGGVNALESLSKKTTGLVLLDSVYSHTVAVVAADSSVRVVTDVANRNGARVAVAFPGLSSGFDSASASLPYYGSPVGGNNNNNNMNNHHRNNKSFIHNSLASYQALGQRLLVTGDGHRYALWDIGQQRKIDERFALPPTVQQHITSVAPFALSPESFVLGLNKSILITDHRMKDHTAGTIHIPQAFAGAGCVSLVSHPGSQHKITGVSYSGLTCIWDVRYSMEIGDSRSILPGYGGSLQPGMQRKAMPQSGYLPGTNLPSNIAGSNSNSNNNNNNNNNSSSLPSGGIGGSSNLFSGKVTTAAIHPLFSEAPLVAGGVNSKFKVMLPDQVLVQRNDQPIACAWHPFEVLGAFTPWTSDVANRRLEIFAAASKDQRTDHIVDLIL